MKRLSTNVMLPLAVLALAAMSARSASAVTPAPRDPAALAAAAGRPASGLISFTLPRNGRIRHTPRALRFSPGELLVLDDRGALDVDARGIARAHGTALAAALAHHGLARGERLGVPAPTEGMPRLLRLRSEAPGFDPVAAAREIMACGAVRAACPNYRLALTTTIPNDSLLSLQWSIQSSIGGDIHLPDAWDLEQGSPAVTIAILDTGVDGGNPDFAGQIWTNSGEIPGNSIDDDHNGFVDDVHGWDFGSNDNDPEPERIPEAIDPVDSIDVGFHGTFCAGIAAAATNNVTGIAGAGWKCRILPIKAASPDSGLYLSAAAGGMQYAALMHADVLSMSFGAYDSPGLPEFFQALVDGDNAAGVICVAAAGNDSTNAFSYPAACDHVIAVGATNEDGTRADFSNWGSWVSVSAPGSSMFSTINENYTFDDLSQLFYYVFFGWDGINPYMYGDGTSFACPLVAGVCGLLRAHRPAITPDQARQLLIATGDALPFDHPMGPRVNAFHALQNELLAVGDAPRTALRLAGAAPNPFASGTTLRFSLAADGPVRLAIYDCAGRLVRELARGSFVAGAHEAEWNGRDAGGHLAADGVYFARLESGGRSLETKLVRLGR